ncbi:hypothetical protein F441_21106 [Phytophthora nicotianae CJ01A1]|uniref:Uncharacterized protein n=3 Tax=Phytophthora nicotianae TaxID=4792 RepID=W2Y412_PHYNI|nr:hypothetical protein F444_21244 [Phytophthora nicotianae P1976]ETP01694.1 hypothetical protein F441_21106 [Phytophthora nicotianae CJ01A1]ETP29850.1 hypothetical protein F442_21048 [Phytophthora nicotianae P10297]
MVLKAVQYSTPLPSTKCQNDPPCQFFELPAQPGNAGGRLSCSLPVFEALERLANAIIGIIQTTAGKQRGFSL